MLVSTVKADHLRRTLTQGTHFLKIDGRDSKDKIVLMWSGFL